ncbi:unnamed protein product, partial [Discosporangium mesarthrocarpum]
MTVSPRLVSVNTGSLMLDDRSPPATKKSMDTLGTIPKIRHDTAMAVPDHMDEYFDRSYAEVKDFWKRGEVAFQRQRYE